MPEFIIHTKAKKRRDLFNNIMFAGIVIYFFLSVFAYDWNKGFKFAPNIFIVLYLIWSGIDHWRARRRKFSIQINEECIEWLLSDSEKRKAVYWNGIRWIKSEKDGGITFFRESSFSEHFSLVDFSEENREEIIRLLQEKANTRQIRLINFSAPTSAVA